MKITNFELGPIYNSLMRNKTGATLVVLQIAITLAVVVNALFVTNSRIQKISMPVGSDSENIFYVNMVSLDSDVNYEDMIRADLELIRNLPGVRSATSPSDYLQSGSTRYEFYKTDTEESNRNKTFANVNYSDEYGLEALGVSLLEGRFFRSPDVKFVNDAAGAAPPSMIITESLGKKIFPDGSAVGKYVYTDDLSAIEVVGVISDVATGWLARDSDFLADTKYNFVLYPYYEYKETEGVNYLIRIKNGDDIYSIIADVENELLKLSPNRLVNNVKTQVEVLEDAFSSDYATLIVLLVVMVLMLVITALGIVGLASYSVKKRTRQIGTRRALGAKKRDIFRYFFVENLLLTTLGVIVGTVLTLGLNFVLVSQFNGNRLDMSYLPLGIIIAYLLGIVAVSWPAIRAAGISPAIATRAT